MNESGRYRELDKAHEDARKAAQESHDKVEVARQDKLREDATAALDLAKAREISQRLGYAALNQQQEEAAIKAAERASTAPAQAPPRIEPQKVEPQPSPVDRPAPAAAHSLPPKQSAQFFSLEGTVATRPTREAETARPADKRQQDYARHLREEAAKAKLQAARDANMKRDNPKEYAEEMQLRRERQEREGMSRKAPAPLTQARAPAAERTSDQLRPDSRPATARGPDTGRLSEAWLASPAHFGSAAREVNDKELRRQNPNSRPKSDREAMREAIRANARSERANRGRGDDDDGGRGR